MNALLRPLVLWVRYWPQLVACYLVGFLGRWGAIELAAWSGHDNDWWAALTMPLAAIARLGSYVAMFLVLRRAIPALADLPRRSARRIDVFSTIVVPFFAIYLAWQMFREDWLAFQARALDYRMAEAFTNPGTTEVHPEILPTSVTTWVVVGGALALRMVLGRLRNRLPTWLVVVRVYVDAVWVFLVLTFSVKHGATLLVNPTGWVSDRRIVVWFNTTRAELFSSFRPLEIAWDFLVSVFHTVFGGATIPLLWLAVAGIVFGATTAGGWRGAVRRTAGRRAEELLDQAAPAKEHVQGRWTKVPENMRKKIYDWVRLQVGRLTPIVDSARVIMHGGVLALSLYVLAYVGLSWLDMSGSFYRTQSGPGYLFRGMALLIGPQPIVFWQGFADTLILVSHMLIEPLRVCLIVSTFAYCLEHVQRSQDGAQQDMTVGAGEVDRGGDGVVGQQEAELEATGFAAHHGGTVARENTERADVLGAPAVLPVGDDAAAVFKRRRAGPVEGDHE